MRKIMKMAAAMAFVLVLAACSPKPEIATSYVTDLGTVRIDKEGSMKSDAELNAPVTVDIFFDPACPACAAYGDETNSTLAKHLDKGNIEVVYHPIGFLNGQTVDDYSNRAGAYILAIAEYAPEKTHEFVDKIVSLNFQPTNPAVDKTDDKLFVEVMKDIKLTDEEIEAVEENKQHFVSRIVASTKDFTSKDSEWLQFAPQGYVFTPFVLVNKTGERTQKALAMEGGLVEVANELNEAIEALLE